MMILSSKRSFVTATILSLLVAFALPIVAFADNDRGRGQDRRYERRDDRRDYGRNNRDWKEKRKSRRFINGHDARDGRWDGRGPRGNWSNKRRTRDDYYRNIRRNRNRYDNRYRQNDRQDDYYNQGTSSNGGTREILGGILGSILSGQ